MDYTIKQSSTYYLCDFTVLFNTETITENAASSLTKDAASLLENQKISVDHEREIHVFVRGGKAVALIHYRFTERLFGRIDVMGCEENCQEVIQQIAALLVLYADGA